MDEINETRETILALLETRDETALREFLAELHYADLAEILPAMDLQVQTYVLRLLDYGRAAQVLFELDREQIPPLLESLGPQATALILQEMSSDDVADLIGALTDEQKIRYLGLMPAGDAEDVQELLEYGADTAGGIMTTELVAINKDVSAEEAINTLRRAAAQAETIYYVYVVNDRHQLVGVISLRELIMAPPGVPVRDVMQTNVISVNVATDQEDVARVVAKYDILAVPVVDDNDVLLGIVTHDDIVDVIQEEATEDILRLASVEEEERNPGVGVWARAWHRLPWLVALLLGELIAGRVIEGYTGTLETVTALAFFITAMAGGPGNAATQSLTVVVRGLATGEFRPRELWPVIWREVQVGLLVGLVSGLVLSLAAYVLQGSPTLGLVVGLALAINIMVATALGSLVPLLVQRVGVDPALASGPFITTLMDVTSMSIYFGLATVFLFYIR
ncbi:MAG: magnesium transporter [Bacillota bacterium]|nr:magnesium transporter [Bacillota bacterium]